MEDFCSSETVFLLAFAIIMLNTDLHNSNIKPDRKMKVVDFVRNLRGLFLDSEAVIVHIISNLHTSDLPISRFRPVGGGVLPLPSSLLLLFKRWSSRHAVTRNPYPPLPPTSTTLLLCFSSLSSKNVFQALTTVRTSTLVSYLVSTKEFTAVSWNQGLITYHTFSDWNRWYSETSR